MALSKRALVSLVVAALVVVGTSGVAFAAAPTVDSESTDTATTSEVTDGATIQYNASTNSTLQYSADSTNSSVSILQNGTQLSEYQNTSNPAAFEVTDATNNYINFTVADDETAYSGVEADAGETVSLTYRLVNDTNVDSPDTNNVTVNWANDKNKSFVRGESSETETADPGFVAETLSSVPLIGSEDNNVTDPASVEDEIGVAGSNQEEITVYIESSNGQDALTETYDAADEAGAVTYDGWVTLDGEFVPVLSSESDAPDWVDTSENTYATLSEDGSQAVIHNAGDTLGDDTENATVRMTGNEKMDPFEIRGMLTDYGAGTLETVRAMITGDKTAAFSDQFAVKES